MSDAVVLTDRVPPHAVMGAKPDALAQALALARRSIVGTARQPASWIPGIFFPLMIAAVNASAMGKSINLPGFEPKPDSFLQFLLPATLIQGVMFGGIIGGTDMAVDIENGFFERLVASPVARSSILVGRLAGAGVLGAIQATVFIVVFALFGARIAGGLPAMVVLVLCGVILAITIGGLAGAIALRTGSQEAVQSSFPLIFVLLFMSSAFFPPGLMTGWYQVVAQNNPLTWMVDGARELVIVGFSFSAALQCLAVASVTAVLAVMLATRQFRKRLAVSS